MSAVQKVIESNEPNKEPLGVASCIVSRRVIAITLNIRHILPNLFGNQTSIFETLHVIVNLRLAASAEQARIH